MSETVLVAFLSVIGTISGSFGGIMVANKLMNYRLEQLEKGFNDASVVLSRLDKKVEKNSNDLESLEKKVEKHNNVVERVYNLEKDIALQEEELKVSNHRIQDLENLEKNKKEA